MTKKEIITISSIVLAFTVAINGGLAAYYLGKNAEPAEKHASDTLLPPTPSASAAEQELQETVDIHSDTPEETSVHEDSAILEQELVDAALQRLKSKYMAETAPVSHPQSSITKEHSSARAPSKESKARKQTDHEEFVDLGVLSYNRTESQPVIQPKPEPPAAKPAPTAHPAPSAQPSKNSKLVADKVLEEAIRAALRKPDGLITQKDLEQLTSLQASNGVKSLQGLNHAVNLKSLILTSNEISDLTPLSQLRQLQYLVLQDNQISNLSPMASIGQLRVLNLNNNRISNIQPLSSLKNLTALSLSGNGAIQDISALSGLGKLQSLYLGQNSISDISPLQGLWHLQELSLFQNRISDLRPLSGLNHLNLLDLNGNLAGNLQPLTGMKSLQSLQISSNQVNDMSPLQKLAALQEVYIRENPLNESAEQVIQSLKKKDVFVEY